MRNLSVLPFIVSAFAMLISSSGLAAKAKAKLKEPKPSAAFVERTLTREGFSKSFIQDVANSYEPKDYAIVNELNVLLFLRKSDYHGIQVTPEAEREVKKFIADNKEVLDKAEAANHVSPAVVASLLWLESRYGRNTGNFHVPSVYLHLIQSSRTSVQKYLMKQASKYAEKKVTAAQHREIVARTHRKADWALQELRALEKAHQWKWSMGKEFRGSFSGAFGMPQFLPSSYIRWARSVNPPAQPMLGKAEDAIMSVAFYLSEHGWKTDKDESQIVSLMQYNNSRDYANAILTLAEKVAPRAEAADKSSDKAKEVKTSTALKGPAPAAVRGTRSSTDNAAARD